MALKPSLLILYLGLSISVIAKQEVRLIIKDGKQGLEDLSGQELIPPIYEKIGWSKGELKLIGRLIGYKENGRWGLISTQNKVITGPDYYQITVFDSSHVMAAIKGTFSNKLFHGLINSGGKTVISCNYFSINKLDEGYQVSSYNNGQVRYGYINGTYSLKVPTTYIDLEKDGNLLFAKDPNYKWTAYNIGQSNRSNLDFDSYIKSSLGLVVEKNGRYGVLTEDEFQEHLPIVYKDITIQRAAFVTVPFPKWEVKDLDINPITTYSCDSLGLYGDMFITYVNGNQELIINGKDIFGERKIQLKTAKAGFLIVKETPTNEWSLTTTQGKVISSEQDSISFQETYFFMLKDGKWSIYNRFGRKLALKTFDQVRQPIGNNVPVRSGDYWGMLDFQGNYVLGLKYDQIQASTSENDLLVKYLDNWGAMDLFGNWIISAKYDSIWSFKNRFVVKSGRAYYLLDRSGRQLYASPDPMSIENGFISLNVGDSLFGVISENGKTILENEYFGVNKIQDLYYGLTTKYIEIANDKGEILADTNQRIQKIFNHSEGFYRIMKDDKYGFIDHNGKLRIANRYDSIGDFHGGMCAIKLRGGWGYVNKQEQLVVQPIYEEVGDYDDGFSIVKVDGNYGVIDREGNWIIRPNYSLITHEPGYSYILKGVNGKLGTANAQAEFRLAEQYDDIVEAPNGLLIVSRKGKYGVMDQEGYQRVPFEYDRIEVKQDYFVMRRLSDE